jgi:hypothetical protein
MNSCVCVYVQNRVANWPFFNIEENNVCMPILAKFQHFFGLFWPFLAFFGLFWPYLPFENLAFFEAAYGQIWPFLFFGTWQTWSKRAR